MHNDVAHGLASSIFTSDIGEAERFLSAEGSDCGVANVNIGPSGAESAALSAAKKTAAAGAKPVRIAGRPICAAPPTRSIIRPSCRSRRE